MFWEVALFVERTRFGADDDCAAEFAECFTQDAGAGTVFLGFKNLDGLVGGVVFERPLILDLVEPQRIFPLQLFHSSAGPACYGPGRRFFVGDATVITKAGDKSQPLAAFHTGLKNFSFLVSVSLMRGYKPRASDQTAVGNHVKNTEPGGAGGHCRR